MNLETTSLDELMNGPQPLSLTDLESLPIGSVIWEESLFCEKDSIDRELKRMVKVGDAGENEFYDPDDDGCSSVEPLCRVEKDCGELLVSFRRYWAEKPSKKIADIRTWNVCLYLHDIEENGND